MTERCSEEVAQSLDRIAYMTEQILVSVQSNKSIAQAINNLADKINLSLKHSDKSVPIRLVYLLFVLVFGLVFGVEIIKHFLPGIGAPL